MMVRVVMMMMIIKCSESREVLKAPEGGAWSVMMMVVRMMIIKCSESRELRKAHEGEAVISDDDDGCYNG
ncbi:hypothetical protein NDU88_008233 [Pleurodeles waltl]|uniref:Secreted protein n=1 Tax=Pleurodeles waltl TaxID=8319 RepID=A0AAV7SUI4_PLEWA|nr:hypothetical protein NDU88_008233 [Pleurodeles waltl]